jgi:hypothetical protein
VISYHVGQNYQSSAALEREQFYNTGEIIPYVIFDGSILVWEQDPSVYENRYRQVFSVARSVTPLFNTYVLEAHASSTSGSIVFKLVTADTVPEDGIIAHIAILEDSLDGAYGMIFKRVCRTMYQIPVDLIYPDSLTDTLTFTHNIPIDKMNAVLFVQDMDTKEVLQATTTPFDEE